MKAALCFLLVTVFAVASSTAKALEPKNGVFLDNEDAYLKVPEKPEIIAKYGYPVEVHHVTTEDGYILEVHRIPHGKRSGPAENKPVVWLQHGILADSSNWITNNEDKALGYVLADLGYDVWMGNARGNTYSKGHVSLTTRDSAFWQFSFNEMGKYDVPAVLSYILEQTGQEQLDYIGHSMGSTMCFVAMSLYPELNSKIKLFTALAPVAYVDHMQSPIALLAPFANAMDWIMANLGINEFLPTGPLMEFLGATICKTNSLFQPVCSNVLFLLAGYNVDQLNKTSLPIVLAHTPAGASVKTVVHYAQEIKSGLFRQFNHGKAQNLEIYGQEEPPLYDTSKITVPVAMFWGQNDWISATPDVYRLAEELPNLVHMQRIRHDRYNHLDFLWALDNDQLLVKPVVDFLQFFSQL